MFKVSCNQTDKSCTKCSIIEAANEMLVDIEHEMFAICYHSQEHRLPEIVMQGSNAAKLKYFRARWISYHLCVIESVACHCE